ncbi:MAG: NIL domain-containing protein [Candidatus Omnitrophica bacterium]|nr:NIL domain-containing protein [Candidatus Omnitrophota bacterium]MDD5238536.1 NIL domain-containing protein [Candidatus Omnitrophota bacterium]
MEMVIGLTFPGELKDEAIICQLCKKFDISLNIVEASFSTYSGWAILGVDGQEQELKKAFEFLRSKGINIENIKTAA